MKSPNLPLAFAVPFFPMIFRFSVALFHDALRGVLWSWMDGWMGCYDVGFGFGKDGRLGHDFMCRISLVSKGEIEDMQECIAWNEGSVTRKLQASSMTRILTHLLSAF